MSRVWCNQPRPLSVGTRDHDHRDPGVFISPSSVIGLMDSGWDVGCQVPSGVDLPQFLLEESRHPRPDSREPRESPPYDPVVGGVVRPWCE